MKLETRLSFESEKEEEILEIARARKRCEIGFLENRELIGFGK